MVRTQQSTGKTERSQVYMEPLDMKQLLEKIKKEMINLTSLKFSTMVGVGIDEETKAHKITLEFVERNAIPDSMDLLGVYEILADDRGTIRSFKRVTMRKRSDAVSGDEY